MAREGDTIQEALGVSVRVDLELAISTIHIWDEAGCFFHICLGKFNVYPPWG